MDKTEVLAAFDKLMSEIDARLDSFARSSYEGGYEWAQLDEDYHFCKEKFDLAEKYLSILRGLK